MFIHCQMHVLSKPIRSHNLFRLFRHCVMTNDCGSCFAVDLALG